VAGAAPAAEVADVASAAEAAMEADTPPAGIATEEAADGATAAEASNTAEEELVAPSPAKPLAVECIEVDSPDTVAVTATAAGAAVAGVALDMASPIPQDGLAITGTRTATLRMVARRRTTRPRTTRRW
jgi:hypothetical protein